MLFLFPPIDGSFLFSCKILKRQSFLLTAEEDSEIASLAHFARIQFAVFMLTFSRHLHASKLMVAVLAQTSWVVPVLNVFTLCHSFRLNPFIVLFRSHFFHHFFHICVERILSGTAWTLYKLFFLFAVAACEALWHFQHWNHNSVNLRFIFYKVRHF